MAILDAQRATDLQCLITKRGYRERKTLTGI